MVSVYSSHINRVTNDTLVMVLAGGQGSRLHELTQYRAKPCIEFGGSYRLIDFPLSNCINSGLKKVGMVTQYKAQSLLRHLVGQSSQFNTNSHEFLEFLPASQQYSDDWYQGTADALYQNIEFIKAHNPRYVLVLSGDHIYKMDYRNILESHLKSGAAMTVSCIEVSIEEARGQFGVMSVDEGNRVQSFAEKPLFLEPLVDKPTHVLASMGNYVFDTEFLIEKLQQDASDVDSTHDFGKDIIPKIISGDYVNAFRFRGDNNTIPYWRDVGTLDSYWRANMDLLDKEPAIVMPGTYWPICTAPKSASPTQFKDNSQYSASIKNTIVGCGCELQSCEVEHSVVSEQVTLHSGVSVSHSLILPNTVIEADCKLKNTIVDSGCTIPSNTIIGYDTVKDQRDGFRVTQQGVTLITQKVLDSLVNDIAGLESSKVDCNECICSFSTPPMEPPSFSHLAKKISVPELKYFA